jgi:hypothetical protein
VSSTNEPDFSREDLATLEAIIAACHASIVASEGQALDIALRAGAAMVAALDRGLVRHGQKKAFYERVCSSQTTAEVYLRLARNRDKLDTAISQRAVKIGSIRAALKIIGPTRPRRKTQRPEKNFKGWSDTEISAALLALGFDCFRRVIPNPFRPQLAAHASGQILRLERARNPNKRLKLVHSVGEVPPTTH